MSPVAALGGAAVFLSAAMGFGWWIRMRTGQSGWIDATWSLSSGAAAVFAALAVPAGEPQRQWLVALLAGAWSLRLGGHIAHRAATAKSDDPRYADMARQWGDDFPRRLFLFLQIQALCGFGLVVSVFVAAHAPRPLDMRDMLAIGLLLLAVAGETIADRQLRRFAHDPSNRGKVCDVGLWGLSRHPNYFFEWLGWCAYPLFAIQAGWPWGWAALIAPALIYLLLVHASGIPPLEAHMLRSRGGAYRAYQARVSPFFPLPPRKRR